IEYTVNEGHLFEGATEVHLVALEHALTFGMWAAGGAMIAAAFYRYGGGGGTLAIAGAILVGVLPEVALATGWGPQYLPRHILGDPGAQPLLAVALFVGVTVAVLAIFWRIARDIPIRPRNA